MYLTVDLRPTSYHTLFFIYYSLYYYYILYILLFIYIILYTLVFHANSYQCALKSFCSVFLSFLSFNNDQFVKPTYKKVLALFCDVFGALFDIKRSYLLPQLV